MGIALGPNQYGKAENRVVRVYRDTDRHEIRDLNVSTSLRGDFTEAHITGEQGDVLPTDTQKNTAFAFAKEKGVSSPEQFGLTLGAHFLDVTPKARRIPHRDRGVHLGAPRGRRRRPRPLLRPARPRGAHHRGDHRRQPGRAPGLGGLRDPGPGHPQVHRLGLQGLPEGPATPPCRRPRTGSWPPRSPRAGATSTRTCDDWNKTYDDIKRTMLEVFASTYSKALQQTLYLMGKAVLEAHPEVAEIKFSAPNKHHFVVDLSPFGRGEQQRGLHRRRPALRPDRGLRRA